MTKREILNALMAGTLAHDEMVAFCEHEIALLDKKAASSKRTSKITPELKEEVYNALCGYENGASLKTLIADNFADRGFTSQKLVPIMKVLADENRVERFMEKRVAMFRVIG